MQLFELPIGYPRGRRRRRRRQVPVGQSAHGWSRIWLRVLLLSVLVAIVRGDADLSGVDTGMNRSVESGSPSDANDSAESIGGSSNTLAASGLSEFGSQSGASSPAGVPSTDTTKTTSVTSKATIPAASAASGVTTGIASLSRSTCPSWTINYITHSLVQQCLKANRTAAPVSQNDNASRQHDLIEGAPAASAVTSSSLAEAATGSLSASFDASSTSIVDADADADSPLDNANFLSFEEWKKQNLARFEKAKDNSAREDIVPSKAGGINNALESMSDGESFDVSLELGGSDSKTSMKKTLSAQSTQAGSNTDPSAPSERTRKKDAGTTCKERFNYASTDCAATILKTNPKCKSASSVLKENKDSYMLNECSIQNKFLIVELCDDILVDTVVLANYEFFSSMFRTFRISVSDRYPVELDRWKVLGTFEAKNAREVQPFAIHNPLIWARYLRVEFLNHYGAEYYCPVSLLRVHGTTMIDELRNPEEPSKVDDAEDAAAAVPAAAPVASDVSTDTVSPSSKAEDGELPITVQGGSESSQTISSLDKQNIGVKTSSDQSRTASTNESAAPPVISPPFPFIGPLLPSEMAAQLAKASSKLDQSVMSKVSGSAKTSQSSSPSGTASSSPSMQISSKQIGEPLSSHNSSSAASTSSSPISSSTPKSPASSGSSQVRSAQPSPQSPSKTSSSQVQPPAPSPTTQESFFKSFHKRLQVLEANAALSLQYMEEQSRILRDAFTKVEKRQKAKVDDFVFHLNTTVMAELRGFRQQYDQLWQSTVIELESHRDQYQREILSVSTRLSMLAEELVWQKRMALVQTTLLVICLALFIFVRSSNGAQGPLEVPIMQQWLNKSHSMLGFPFDSPRPASASSNKGKSAIPSHVNEGSAAGMGRRLMRVRSVDDLDEDSDEHQLLSSPSPAPMTTTGAANAAAHLRVDHDAYDYDATTPTKANFGNGNARMSLTSDDMESASSPVTDSEVESATSISSSVAASRLKAMVNNDAHRGKSTHRPQITRNRSSNDSLGISWTTNGTVDEYAVREPSPLMQEVHASIEEVDDEDREQDEEMDAYEDASDHGSSLNVSSPSVGYDDSPIVAGSHSSGFRAAQRHDTPLYDNEITRT